MSRFHRAARPKHSANYARSVRTRAWIEPLESRRLLAVLGPVAVDYDTVSPAWFASVEEESGSGAIALQSPAEEHEWIVRLRPEALNTATSPAAVAPLLNNAGSGPWFQGVRGLGLPGQVLVSSTASQSEIESTLAAHPLVASFGPNSVIYGASDCDDPRFPDDDRFCDQVSLNNTGQATPGQTSGPDINVLPAWEEFGKGERSVVVAVLDTGIAYDHPDLSANMWTDNAGHHGYDFVNNDAMPYDDHGHGTHVAGTIGAEGSNGIGITGVAQKTSLMALKVLDANNRGVMADAVDAINYATDMRRQGTLIRVINASFGNYAPNPALEDAIRAAGDAGILFVAAAGNGQDGISGVDTDTNAFYPASYDLDNIISVAAVDSNDKLAKFSNYGPTSVDLAAPGIGVLSTWAGDCVQVSCYATSNGTSMAAPHVSGVAALIWSHFEEATVKEVRDAILEGVDHVPGLEGVVASAGRLNAHKALKTDTIAPRASMTPVATITQGGGDSLFITVKYFDNHKIDRDRLPLSKLTVARLGKSVLGEAVPVLINSSNDAQSIEVTYQFTPPAPDHKWSAEDSGNYEVRLPADSVFDVVGNAVAGGFLNGFRVEIEEPGVIRVTSASDNPATGVTLREAILQANESNSPTKILLPALKPGEAYKLSLPGFEDRANAGDLDIAKDVTIEGEGFASTIIDAAQATQLPFDRVFDVRPGGTLRLKGVTVKGGWIEAEGGEGGGIRNLGTLQLDDVVVRDNQAVKGGGLFNGANAKAEVRATSFVLNEATEGGGVYNTAAAIGARPALDSLQAVGGEVLVNSPHASQQQLPVVAMDDANNSLVVWESFDGGDSGRIYARRFDAAGNPGPQLLVNISGPQRVHPTVAMNKSGEAVIAWQGYGADGSGWGIHMRRVNANGTLAATEFVPYTATVGHQTAPSVAIDDDGDILVVWAGMGAGDSDGVFARFYMTGGQIRDFKVNTATDRQQVSPLAEFGADGKALIVWSSEEADGRYSLRGQLYNSGALSLGTEIDIASDGQASLLATSLVATRDGFAAAWSRISDEGATEQVELQLFRFVLPQSLLQKVGDVVPLSAASSGLERGAGLAALADGGLIATFASLGRDGEGWGVYARQFDEHGNSRSAEFRVNSTTSGSQLNPRVAASSVNQVSIVWNGKGTGDLGGIFLQRYEASYDEDSVLAAATLLLENVTISYNHATTNGGGVFSAAEAVTALVHTTIAQNTTDAGSAGIYGEAGGTLAIKSSLIAGNLSGNTTVTQIDLGGALASLGYNLLGATNGATGFGRATDQVSAQAAAGLDGLPSDGSPLVHQLLPNSLAIDAADPVRSPAFDQLGAPRPQDGDGDGVLTADIGAVERYNAELSGVRFQDTDGDGVRDANEPVLAGLVVYLDKDRDGRRDAGETFVVTKPDGSYKFENLAPGVHYVATESQPGWKRTSPSWLSAAGTAALDVNVSLADLVAVRVDADTYLDLVALESNPDAASDRLIILKNDGQGSFAPSVYVSTGVPWAASTLAHGDIDFDGDVDFIVAHTASAGYLTLLRNRGDGTFDAPSQLPYSASFPSAPLLVELTGDQFVDLVWLEPDAGFDGGKLRVALNNGAGVFLSPQSYAVSGLAEVIVAGNFNLNQQGATTIDLIVGTDLLLNSGNGLFIHRSLNLIDAVTPNQAADLDGDGELDLVGLQRAAREFGVLLNKGGAVFEESAAMKIALPGLPQDVALGDWDRDGDLDAAVALDDLGRVEILLNDGHGQFTIEGTSRLSPTGAPASLAVGDWNSDGFADLSVALDNGPAVSHFANSRGQQRADLYAGEAATGVDFGELPLQAEIRGRVFHDLDQNGIFNPGVEPILSGREVYLDLNGNGLLDRFPIDPNPTDSDHRLVLEPDDATDSQGNYVLAGIEPFTSFAVRVVVPSGWLQTTPREDQATSEYEVELKAAEVLVGRDFGLYQFNNYGVSTGTIQGRYYRDADNNGEFTLGEGVRDQMVYIDADGSGGPNGNEVPKTTDANGFYSITAGPGVHAVRVVPNPLYANVDPLGNRFSDHVAATGTAPQAVALYDFDQDGDSDIFTANALSNDVSVVRNNGDGNLQLLGPISANNIAASGPSSIVIADLDGGYGDDIAITNQFSSTVTVFLSDGRGWFVLGGVYDADEAPSAIAAGDIDGDGRLDLIVVSETKNELRILGNQPGGVFAVDQVVPVSGAPYAVAAIQLNDHVDDRAEVAVGRLDSQEVTIFRNVAGQLTQPFAVSTGAGPASIAFSDLDGDGEEELITANAFAGNVTVRWNNGFGEFTNRTDLELGSSPMSISVADIDLDGDGDLLVTTKLGDGKIRGLSVLRNLHRNGMPRGFAAVEAVSVGVARFDASEHLSLAAGDMNRDGIPDVVVASGYSNKVSLLLNERVDGAHYVTLDGLQPGQIVTRDFAVRFTSIQPTLDAIGDVLINEDILVQQQIPLNGVSAGSGEEGQPLRVTVNTDLPQLFAAGPVVGPNNSSVTYRLAPNQWGSARMTVTVTDGGADNRLITEADNESFSRSFFIHVAQVNDPPTFVLETEVEVDEDSPTTATEGLEVARFLDYGPLDPPQNPLVYSVSGYNQDLFDVLPAIDVNGQLRFKLRENENGPLDLQVRLRDGGGGDNESAPQTLRLIVKPVNDPPSFTVGPDITIREDAGPQEFNRITNISPGAENERLNQTVEFLVENDNPELFTAAGQPKIDADGKIRFHSAPNANGIANLSIIARDSLDEVSAVKPLRIVVNAVNDPPSFVGRHVTAFSNTGLNVIPLWATEIDVGAVNESDQRVFFFTSPQLISNPAIFANADGQPRVTPDGTLTFTLAAEVAGSTTFTMVLFDTGVGEGIGNFAKSFTLTVGLEGETNGDGRVDITDLNNVRNNFGAQSSNGAPVLGDTYPIDGRVDIKDLNAVRNQFGSALSGAPTLNSRNAEQLQRQRAADLLFQNWQAAAATPIRPSKSRR